MNRQEKALLALVFLVGIPIGYGLAALRDEYRKWKDDKDNVFDQFCEILIDTGDVDELYEVK